VFGKAVIAMIKVNNANAMQNVVLPGKGVATKQKGLVRVVGKRARIKVNWESLTTE
jgi:hypothetical protein